MDISAASDDKVSEDIDYDEGLTRGNGVDIAVTNGETVSQRDEHQFLTAISAWRSRVFLRPTLLVQANGCFKDIDLSHLVQQLDSTAADIVANQRDSLVQRKDLAQKTKDFRKLEDSEKLTEYKGLLKCMHPLILRKGITNTLQQPTKLSLTSLPITERPRRRRSYSYTPRFPKLRTPIPYWKLLSIRY